MHHIHQTYLPTWSYIRCRLTWFRSPVGIRHGNIMGNVSVTSETSTCQKTPCPSWMFFYLIEGLAGAEMCCGRWVGYTNNRGPLTCLSTLPNTNSTYLRIGMVTFSFLSWSVHSCFVCISSWGTVLTYTPQVPRYLTERKIAFVILLSFPFLFLSPSPPIPHRHRPVNTGETRNKNRRTSKQTSKQTNKQADRRGERILFTLFME